MSTDNEKETPKAEVPNSHLAEIHSKDNKDVVKEKSEAEAEEREANKIEPGVNTHLADVHAGKVNEAGENIEPVTVPEDVERNGGPSSEPLGEKTEEPSTSTEENPEKTVEAGEKTEEPSTSTEENPEKTVEAGSAEA